MPAGSDRPRWRVALVTGASSGIGEAMARRLADRGTDLVLVARRQDRLEDLAAELSSRHGREVEVIRADLADRAELGTVEARLADGDRPIDLLVNNAGFGTRGNFSGLPIEEEEKEVRVNVVAPVRLTRAVLPGMLEGRHGGIVNVSSLAGLLPIPYWATYAATKAYLTSFSIALHEEVKDQGVTVVAVMPGFTRTEFQNRESLGLGGVPGAMWASGNDVAISALRALDQGRASCVPGLRYRLLSAALRFTPWTISRRLGRSGGERIQALSPNAGDARPSRGKG